MSKVLSLRLKETQMERLERVARKLGKKPSETAAVLLEEALRHEENPLIEIRHTLAGREAFIVGTRLKVWHVETWAQHGKSAAEIAAALDFREDQIAAALTYIETYPDEIAATIADNEAAFDALFPEAAAERTTQTSAAAS